MEHQEVRLVGALDYENLKARWPGVIDSELTDMISYDVLPAYELTKRLVSPEGEVVHFCLSHASPWREGEWGDSVLDWTNILFDRKDVERIEAEKTEYTWEPALEKDEETDYWLNCGALGSRWGCSPFDVVGTLKKDGFLCPRVKPFYHNWDCHVDTLDQAEIHIRDLLKWEAENKPHLSGLEGSCGSCEALRKEVERLKALSAEGGASQKANTAPGKAILATIPAIVAGVLAIKDDWDGAPETSPKKVAGYSEKEIRDLVPESLSREQAREIKKAIGKAGIKVKKGRGTRKTP